MVANRSTRRGDGRDALIDAALRLIAARGLASFSMREVAAEADLSLGSVTYHFAKRDTLIEAVLSQYIETFETVTSAALEASTPQIRDDATRTLIAALGWVLADRRHAMVAAEVRVHAARDETVRQIQARLESAFKAIFSELRRRQELGNVHASDAAVDALYGTVLRAATKYSSLDRYTETVLTQLNHLLEPSK